MKDQTVSIKMNVEGKNIVIAYLLWWFLGWAGVHRFYLGRVKSGIMQLLLFVLGWVTAVFVIGYVFILVWFIWWALDAYFTYRIVAKENKKLGVNSSTFSISKVAEIEDELVQLDKLHTLFEKGVLTKEQYELRKEKMMLS